MTSDVDLNPTLDKNKQEAVIIVIGAGLTGLTTAFALQRRGFKVLVLERSEHIGGQIQTFSEKGYTFESGPNTGVISYPEIAELFQQLNDCKLETACEAAKCRMIWKKGKFHPIPSGLFSAIFTPLFAFKDKINILGEPFRTKGINPNESVKDLTVRRLGRSFFQYAVDPFLSGVYAGDPTKLITRYALPKLYNLEQNYGSFIRGAVAKARQPKTDRDKLATKQVFSAHGGLSNLTNALAKRIGSEQIILGAEKITVKPDEGEWKVDYIDRENKQQSLRCTKVISTVGAYSLEQLFPFLNKEQLEKITNLRYAPVVQVSVGIRNPSPKLRAAFGGLVPTCEKQPVLGILFPSDCFQNRAPQGCSLYSFFMGGIRHPEFVEMNNDELTHYVKKLLHTMLGFDRDVVPDIIQIFRHEKAIPQYEQSSGARFEAITQLENEHPGLILAGNIIGGIGMADRIQQAYQIASRC